MKMFTRDQPVVVGFFKLRWRVSLFPPPKKLESLRHCATVIFSWSPPLLGKVQITPAILFVCRYKFRVEIPAPTNNNQRCSRANRLEPPPRIYGASPRYFAEKILSCWTEISTVSRIYPPPFFSSRCQQNKFTTVKEPRTVRRGNVYM